VDDNKNFRENQQTLTRRTLLLRNTFIFFALFLLMVGNVHSVNRTGDFLTVGVGARALALGEAFAGIADDATAIYWNPAGLGQINRVEIALMRSIRPSGLGSYNYAAIVNHTHPMLAVGVGWYRFSVDDIPIYPELDANIDLTARKHNPKYRPSFEPESFLSNNENAYFISAAIKYSMRQEWWDKMGTMGKPPEFMFGMNLKRIAYSLLDKSAEGSGFDAGVLVKVTDTEAITGIDIGEVSAGFTIHDISDTTIKWNTVSVREEDIPTNVRYSVAYRKRLNEFKGGILLAYQYSTRYKEHDLGFEYDFDELLFLRLGSRAGNFTVGSGISIGKFDIDYAFVNNGLCNTHRISLLVSF